MNTSLDTSQLAGRRILIVDDVEDNRVVLDRQLRKSGFETSLCSDGMAAVAEVSSNPPDLVLLDWMMPGLSGMETLTMITGIEASAASAWSASSTS